MSHHPFCRLAGGALLLCLLHFTVFSQNAYYSGQPAELMLSGLGFNQTGGPLRFNHPNGLASDGQNLIVCDRFNNRVLIWKQAPEAWNDAPDIVLGQPDFDQNNPGTAKNQLNWPGNASTSASGVLAIADTDNDRILLWKQFPQQNAQTADLELSLPALTPPGAAQQWGWPWGVWTDGLRLAAVATSGHVLLFWNQLPQQDNQPPDYTIDLPQFGTPRNISTDGSSFFFVGDHNAKVNGQPGTFFWNAFPSSADQPYDFYRNEWIKGIKTSNGALVASGLMHIYTWTDVPEDETEQPDFAVAPSWYKNGDGVDVVEAGGKIFVNNYNGNNVLAYAAAPQNASESPLFALGVSDHLQNSLDSIAYIQNPALSTDGQRLFVSSDFDRRIFVYNNLPTASGAKPDQIISTNAWNLAPWDNALYNNQFVIAGGHGAAVWNNAQNLNQNPSQLFNGSLGTATFSDLRGVALDADFFYLADRNGKIYLWAGGVPANTTTNPTYTISLSGVQLARLSSDGVYFCVARQSPAAVLIYRVEDLKQGDMTPWKTVDGFGLLNLPSEVFPFNGSVAVANQGAHNVLWWKDIAQCGDANKAVVLGQPNLNAHWPGIGPDRLFMPGALAASNGDLWVGEFKFSSRILKYKSAAPVAATEPENESYSFNFSPNPASTRVKFAFDDEIPTEIRISDLTGRVLERIVPAERQFEVELSGLAPGLYVVFDGKNSRKLIKI